MDVDDSEPKLELSPATYAELFDLDNTFDNIDAVVTAFQDTLAQPIYKKRAELSQRIPGFWPLVFEQAPPDVDQYIQPSDSNVLTNFLTGFSVDRFESKPSAEAFASLVKSKTDNVDDTPFGEPRSFTCRFEFKENEYFEDKVLEKKFWYRRSVDGEGDDASMWSGRVSEPVKIHWKSGKDLSEGLTDSAYALWEAQTKKGLLDAKDHNDAKAKEEETKKLPEYQVLMNKVENSTEGSQSFFNWFSYRGPWISAAQDKIGRVFEKEQAKKAANEQANAGMKEADDSDDDEDLDEMATTLDVEVFPEGEDLALALSEDVWPNAIKMFLDAQDEDASDMDIDMDDGSFDEADMEELDEEELGKANLEEIKGLAGRVKKGTPPAKKRKA